MSNKTAIYLCTIVMILSIPIVVSAEVRPTGAPFSSSLDVIINVPKTPVGTDLKNVFADWNIEIEGDKIVSEYRQVSPGPAQQPPPPLYWIPTLINGSTGGESSSTLVITLKEPAQLIGLDLLGGGVTNRITVFDPNGNQLADHSFSFFSGFSKQIGFEATEGELLSQVAVSYEEYPEELIMIGINYYRPSEFKQCIAQFAHGSYAEPGQILQTILTLTHKSEPTLLGGGRYRPNPIADLTIDFKDIHGQPLMVELDGSPGNQFPYTLQALESRAVQTTGQPSSGKIGYICGRSNYPFELATVFRVLDTDGSALSEAGLNSGGIGHRFVGVFQKESANHVNSGIAVVNLGDSDATILFEFTTSPDSHYETEMILNPVAQRAWFIDELIPELSSIDATGTVTVTADQPVATIILRTIRGVVTSSLSMSRILE
jgi:hypothetical protein